MTPTLRLLLPCLMSVVAASVARGQASFQGLGDLPGGTFQSQANDISDDGSTIVGESESANGLEAFRWSAGVMTGLGDLPGGAFYSFALGVNGDGSVIVGGSVFSDHTQAVRWDGQVMVGLGVLPGDTSSIAHDVSNDGEAVCGYSVNGFLKNYSHVQAFRWETGTMIGLLDLPTGADDCAAAAISADGSVIAGRGVVAGANYAYEACRWNDGSVEPIGLGDLPGGDHNSGISGMSAGGSVMVGNSCSANSVQGDIGGEACVWINDTIMPLGDLPGGGVFNSNAFDVSDDGSTIVGHGTTDQGSEAFIWTLAQEMRNLRGVLTNDFGLDLTGWTLSKALATSADGRSIVGYGVNPSGQPEAWLAHLPCGADVAPQAGDGAIDVDDLIAVILQWGTCTECRADIDHNGVVDVDDLIAVILAWGPCS